MSNVFRDDNLSDTSFIRKVVSRENWDINNTKDTFFEFEKVKSNKEDGNVTP